jgi:glycerophosphoryl diester phosphodiesterase
MPGIVAHRGASAEAPENTLAALRRAWELGAESSEIDVRVTRDGHVVVIHDDTTRRTSGGRAALVVAEATLAELQAVDVGSWKGDRYAGEPIPTLAAALDATPPGRMLFVEVKTTAADAEVIAKAVLAADPRKRGATLALQAYDPDALAAVAGRLPGVESYWTVDPPTDAQNRPRPYPPDVVRTAAERRFTGVAVDQRGADDAFVAAVAEAGLLLDVWTVNDAGGIRAWRSKGARWIETDYPELGRIPEEATKP